MAVWKQVLCAWVINFGRYNPFPYLVRSYAPHGNLSLTSVILSTP